MKKIAILFILALLSVACGKKSDPAPTPANDIYMSATADNQSLSITGQGNLSNMNGVSCIFQKSNNSLYIVGAFPQADLNMQVSSFPKKAGDYDLTLSGNAASYFDTKSPLNPVVYVNDKSEKGVLSISLFDGKTVEGTFYYSTYNNSLKKAVKVTGGKFKVPYVEQ